MSASPLLPSLLVVGEFPPHGTGTDRARAFARLGFPVARFDVAPYAAAGGPWRQRLRIRLLMGRAVDRLNADLVAWCARERPAYVWFDKPTFVRPATLERLRSLGCILINYVIDNPFATLPGEPGWRLVRKAIPHYDVNVVPRDVGQDDYRRAGAALVLVMPLAFEPWSHHPPPGAAAPRRTVPVRFIGSPYGDRPRFVADLARRGIAVSVLGARWDRHAASLPPEVDLGPPAYGPAYREALWESAVCLGFVTHAHRDPAAHRAFEITASGSFLLAERTDGHLAAFEEDREAVFFSDLDEAADKAAFYVRDAAAREAIAHAGCLRAWRSGYSNDERQAEVFAVLRPDLAEPLRAKAAAVVAARRAELGMS